MRLLLFILLNVCVSFSLAEAQERKVVSIKQATSPSALSLNSSVDTQTQVQPRKVMSATEAKVVTPQVKVTESQAVTVIKATPTPKPKTFVSNGITSQERLMDILEEKVEKALEKKDYALAVSLYEKYAQKPSWSDSNKTKILDALRKLNYEMLFSGDAPTLTTPYKVKKGDSLYKIARHNKMTTIEMIQKLNGLKGDVIYPDQELKLLKEPFKVLVDKSENKLYLFAGEKPIKEYIVSTGKDGNTPEGEFKIVNKLKNPTWYKTGAVIPSDSPENELGTRWLGFDEKGYGIHGTIEPDKLGQSISAGCVRMKNEDVEEIFGYLPHQTLVKVTG